jgi:hypothetical protein
MWPGLAGGNSQHHAHHTDRSRTVVHASSSLPRVTGSEVQLFSDDLSRIPHRNELKVMDTQSWQVFKPAVQKIHRHTRMFSQAQQLTLAEHSQCFAWVLRGDKFQSSSWRIPASDVHIFKRGVTSRAMRSHVTRRVTNGGSAQASDPRMLSFLSTCAPSL